jgi:hypothetical protein
MVPEHLWRHSTRAAIDALAVRFDLPNTLEMQDWEWEVADADRIDEFVAAYQSGQLDDDERFTLMETIIQSFEDLGEALHVDARWQTVIELLNAHIKLHAYTVWYWANPDEDHYESHWTVTPSLRQILRKHRDELALG